MMNGRATLRDIMSRPEAGALIGCFLAGLALAYSWAGTTLAALRTDSPHIAFVTLFLIGALVIANRYPIHVQSHTKVLIITVPLFLMAVLLPPALAAPAAGLGILIDELKERRQRRSLLSDIITNTSRWIVLVSLGAWVAHLPADTDMIHAVLLVAAAIVMFAGDLVTISLQVASISGEPPLRVLRATAREVSASEGVQYLLGILGAIAAEIHIWALVLLIVPCVVVFLAFKNLKEMRNSTRWLLESMADAVDLRDPYTGGHSRRVAEYCAGILRQLERFGPEVDLIVSAARVHDIGKIGIPDQILNKPDRLTEEERAIMETHSDRGADLLARYPDFARGVAIVRHHHESWNGAGYPAKLEGYEIPFGSRVIAVADSFDAMTSDRPYRRGMPPAKAAQILREGCGKQWDTTIVEAFLRSIADQLEPQLIPSLQYLSTPIADTVALEAVI
jgi:HD-GYP domain-containing protein (c-di-GMP phosphodiesterase class II)